MDFVLENENITMLERLEQLEEGVLRPIRLYQTRRNYFDELSESNFAMRFRLSKQSCLDVLGLIESHLEYPNNRNKSVAPINQLLLALRYYATGCHQMTMGDFAGVHRSTANRCIHRVSAALASLSSNFIHFPETDYEIKETQLNFYKIAKFPKVLGALDCTHVKIFSPGGPYAETFRNRKGYMSLNVQAICNANLVFTDMVARWPGSCHDERIFSSCRRNAYFEMGKYAGLYLVADSGYMNRNYLMMPLQTVTNPSESLYNESQIRTRNPIERAFGVWKRRFPVLAFGMHLHLKNSPPIIMATAVLHNILRKKGEELPPDDSSLILPAPWEAALNQGQIREQRVGEVRDINAERRRLINNYFSTLQP